MNKTDAEATAGPERYDWPERCDCDAPAHSRHLPHIWQDDSEGNEWLCGGKPSWLDKMSDLKAEVARLRAALQGIIDIDDRPHEEPYIVPDAVIIAQEALKGSVPFHVAEVEHLEKTAAALRARLEAALLRELALIEVLTEIQDYCGYRFSEREPGFEPLNIARCGIVANEEARSALEGKP